MDDKMTKEVEKVVEKVYYVKEIEKLDSEYKKNTIKMAILGMLVSGLCFAGAKSGEFGFVVASFVSTFGAAYYGISSIINTVKSSNIEKKLKGLEEKEKIEEELKGLEEPKEMEGKTK